MAKDRIENRAAPGSAGKVDLDPVQRQFRQRPGPFTGQNQPQPGLGTARLRQSGGIQRTAVLQIIHRLQPHWPQSHLLRRGIDRTGGQPVAVGRNQPGAARHQMAVEHGLHLRTGMQDSR